MVISVESRRKKLTMVVRQWPGATVIDVTSRGDQPWVRFSPFYPHGGIPIPGTPGEVAESVEGLRQGLKVFEREGVDPSRWAVTDMRGIKRPSGTGRGAVRGHRFGDGLLGYRDARLRIYLPAYRWVLENRLVGEAAWLRELASGGQLVLLDYETNGDADDLSSPLSDADLIGCYLDARWPSATEGGE